MTTYRAISDTEVAVDAPLTQQLLQALKDNVLAIQEGDSSASSARIQNAAFAFTAGDFFLDTCGTANESDFSTSAGPRTIATSTTHTAQYNGTFRFRLYVDVTATNGTAGETDQFNFQTQLFKNGSLVASSPTATSQGQAAQINTHDIAVSIGDTLVVKLEQTGGTGARTVSVESNCEVYVASSTVPFAETITT